MYDNLLGQGKLTVRDLGKMADMLHAHPAHLLDAVHGPGNHFGG